MSNCLLYALKQFYKYGGSIIISKSRYGKWLHFSWSKDMKSLSHYVPKKKPLKYPLFQKWLFRGEVKIKDIERD